MRKIVIHCTTNQVGTDSWEFYGVPDNYTNEELNNLAWEVAKDNAEMYGIYPLHEYTGELSEEELDSDEYTDDIDGNWMDYVPEKHDGHTMNGSEPNWHEI